jgi:hypothetical protein
MMTAARVSVLKAVDFGHSDERGTGNGAASAGSPQLGGGTIKPVSDQQRWIPEFNECRQMIGTEDFGADQSNFSQMNCGNVPQGDESRANENEAALGGKAERSCKVIQAG